MFLSLIVLTIVSLISFSILLESSKHSTLSDLLSGKPANKYVLISTSVQESKDFYTIYLPVVCQAWLKIHFQPIVVLVLSDSFIRPSNGSSRHFRTRLNLMQLKVIEYLKRMPQVKIYYFTAKPGYDVATGMLARMFVGFMTERYIESDNDFVLLSDSDLVPIDATYYELPTDANVMANQIVIWNAHCCGNLSFRGKSYQQYPMSHIGMTKRHWRRIIQFDMARQSTSLDDATTYSFSSDSIERKLENFYNEANYMKKSAEIERGDRMWSTDQFLMSVSIEEYAHAFGVSLDKRHYKGMRLDRSQSSDSWRSSIDSRFDMLTDAHLYHDHIFVEPDLLSKLYKKLFNDPFVIEILDEYLNQYILIRRLLFNNSNNNNTTNETKNLILVNLEKNLE